MLYSSGTTGRPKGVKVPLPGGPVPARTTAVGALAAMLFGADQDTVYLSPAPLYHAAPLRFCMAGHRIGATVVVMEHFDPERLPRASSSAPGHLHPGRAHDVHPHCSSCPDEVRARYDLSSLRGRRPRRRALPGRGEGADDRVVGAGDPRVLRRHRGQRLRLLQQRAVAGPQGHGRRARCSARSTSSTRTATRSRSARPAPSTSRARRASSTTATPRRPTGSRDPQGPGLVDARRRRLRRRGRLPLPHRPQGVHDHQRRREHLPAGGREPPGDAPEGRRRRRLRHPRRRDGRGASTPSCSRPTASRRRPRSPPS